MRVSDNQHSLTWRLRFSPGSAEAYALATVFVVISSLVRWGFSFVSNDIFIFAAFYPAVLFATYVGGLAVGIFAAVLGAVIALWAFMPYPLTSGVEIKLLAYIFASTLIIWGAEHYRRLRKSFEDEEKFRKLAVDELAHRLKNKLATIQSIISFQLRDDPPLRDTILSRLSALSATDDLIMAAQGKGARIRDILAAELAPYDVSRASMDGPDCLLYPKLALTMTLLVHELATNAAKYGALSGSAGKLCIAWSLSHTRLSLEWRETGGPHVTAPSHRGFGTRLLTRALDPLGGTIETAFETPGLICRLEVNLPEHLPSLLPEITDKSTDVLAPN